MDLAKPSSASPHGPRGARAAEASAFKANIGTLAFRGFPELNARRVKESFTTELGVLLKHSQGLPSRFTMPRERSALRLRLSFQRRPTAEMVGREVARGIFEALFASKEATQ